MLRFLDEVLRSKYDHFSV